jgi:hypothetical protein
MKNRPLAKIYLLNLVSLGIYQLIWFSETKREIAAHGIKMPRMNWLVASSIISSLAIIACLLAVLTLVSLNGKGTVSNSCWQAYVFSSSPDRDFKNAWKNAGGPTDYTPQCKQQIAESQSADHKTIVSIAIFGISIVIVLICVLIFYRWLNYYSLGIQKITNGQVSQTRAMGILGLLPAGVGIVLMQDIFNKLVVNQPSPPQMYGG